MPRGARGPLDDGGFTYFADVASRNASGRGKGDDELGVVNDGVLTVTRFHAFAVGAAPDRPFPVHRPLRKGWMPG
jgi:hypothetical protein